MSSSEKVLPDLPLDEPETLENIVRQKTKGSDLLALMGCNLIVFVASLCIMVLELTASRLIAKHVGSSLYTWTSVIGVVLAGLTVGNYLGGWMADKISPRRLLSWLFLVSSVFCFAVLWLDQIVGDMTRPDGMQWPTWVLCQVAIVFLLPATALGTISPVVAALALSRNTRTGITVGNVYAWGALGSIVGTFLTGFYLIDLFGTKAIVGMVSATLAIMGLLVATRQWAFRAAVLCGWLQFIAIFGLAASIDTAALAEFIHGQSAHAGEQPPEWQEVTFTERIADSLHDLGLALNLRDDSSDAYHDESSYSYINVADAEEDGDKIKRLRLDKLIHSYYNPRLPTKLYYDYEKLYAAVTERVAVDWDRVVTVPLADSDRYSDITEKLPEWVHFNSQKHTLQFQGAMNPRQRATLLELTPYAGYWKAVNELFQSSGETAWSGYAAVDLDHLPDNARIPKEWSQSKKVQFDPERHALIAQSDLTAADRDRLLGLGHAEQFMGFYRAVEELYGQSRQVSTFFIGGGGFVFPRWIEAKFPDHPRIDVAELDPAVKLAVQREMGLANDNETAINTYIGDARNVVDDRLLNNVRLVEQGRPPVLYDFIYGDAFNDFSVPWHLTTLEFTQKIQRLLTPSGVYLVNIIDIYPRTAFPKGKKRYALCRFDGHVPAELLDASAAADQWNRSLPPYGGLEVYCGQFGHHQLRFNGAMRVDQYAALKQLSQDADFQKAIRSLYDQSNAFASIEGSIPNDLLDAITPDQEWQACSRPFQTIELKPLDDAGGYRMAVRGIMSETLRKRLIALEPSNMAFNDVVNDLFDRSEQLQAGRFLATFVNTMAQVFPNVYVFSSDVGLPHAGRDTFVVIGSQRTIQTNRLSDAGQHWYGRPFAWMETDPKTNDRHIGGHMTELARAANGLILTDDYAPVDNLLSPVFCRQN